MNKMAGINSKVKQIISDLIVYELLTTKKPSK